MPYKNLPDAGFAGGVHIEHLGGLFGIGAIPEIPAKLFSVFAMVIILNAYNLIDGADGLAATVGIVASIAFGTLLFQNGAYSQAMLAFTLTGALFGFLYFNFEPARIFMGDTGSMVVGFLLAYLGFAAMQANAILSPVYIPAIAIFVFAALIIPMFDTMRIIALRLYKRQSPLRPDHNHLHHVLQRYGYSHRGVALVIAASNTIILLTAFIMRFQEVHLMLALALLQAWLILPVAAKVMQAVQHFESRRIAKMLISDAHTTPKGTPTPKGSKNGGQSSKKPRNLEPAEIF
jgi:UDP-GlcNAc:undecaprenyl-phosphate/decaprenyl-phosphate GlcNAc-1-phosphate transferase